MISYIGFLFFLVSVEQYTDYYMYQSIFILAAGLDISGDEPYYPINDQKNTDMYRKYAKEARNQDKIIFGGRLGMYQYFDMDKVIGAALYSVSKNL